MSGCSSCEPSRLFPGSPRWRRTRLNDRHCSDFVGDDERAGRAPILRAWSRRAVCGVIRGRVDSVGREGKSKTQTTTQIPTIIQSKKLVYISYIHHVNKHSRASEKIGLGYDRIPLKSIFAFFNPLAPDLYLGKLVIKKPIQASHNPSPSCTCGWPKR